MKPEPLEFRLLPNYTFLEKNIYIFVNIFILKKGKMLENTQNTKSAVRWTCFDKIRTG